MTGKTLEEIIQQWNNDFQSDASTFRRIAAEVSKWDMQLISNQEKMLILNRDVERLQLQQAGINTNLTELEKSQTELDQILTTLEGNIKDHYQEDKLARVDEERANMYKNSEDISDHLSNLLGQVGKMVDKLNSAYDKVSDPQNKVTQVVTILNNHLHALSNIERQCATLQLNVQNINKDINNKY